MSNTPQSSFRLSQTARDLLAAIGESLGIDKTATLEVIIREAAAQRSIKPSAD